MTAGLSPSTCGAMGSLMHKHTLGASAFGFVRRRIPSPIDRGACFFVTSSLRRMSFRRVFRSRHFSASPRRHHAPMWRWPFAVRQWLQVGPSQFTGGSMAREDSSGCAVWPPVLAVS